jgi:Raf kinase inhibitor-like YbhB/YbcL family protein
MSLTLMSAGFVHNGDMPARYTCDDRNLSPPLSWNGVPAAAKSLMLIVDDPDAPDPKAPRMIWVHWILYNIPPMVSELPEGVASNDLPPGTRRGVTDRKDLDYHGPCPPIGRHRYFHKLYALDILLPDLGSPPKAKLEEAMRGHVLAEAQLIGTYQRRK